jgi:hypothetical protein
MIEFQQCYYKDSGMVYRWWAHDDANTDADGFPERPIDFVDEPWFDAEVHEVSNIEHPFPQNWERWPWFVVPSLNTIKRSLGLTSHPLTEVLKAQFTRDEFESVEDEIGCSQLRDSRSPRPPRQETCTSRQDYSHSGSED